MVSYFSKNKIHFLSKVEFQKRRFFKNFENVKKKFDLKFDLLWFATPKNNIRYITISSLKIMSKKHHEFSVSGIFKKACFQRNKLKPCGKTFLRDFSKNYFLPPREMIVL